MTSRRRSSEEVRSLVLDAARELFAEHGFGGATTRDIARRADVSETILFRNFTSKERLFQEAVARPIDELLTAYTGRWLDTQLGDEDPDEMIHAFVESLFDLATANRKLLLAALPNHLGRGAQPAFDKLEHMARETKQSQGWDYDPRVAVRAAVGMVITVAVFEEALFGSISATRRDTVIAELAALLAHGLTRRGSRSSAPGA
jgi:AcrR family transcriptional regulator